MDGWVHSMVQKFGIIFVINVLLLCTVKYRAGLNSINWTAKCMFGYPIQYLKCVGSSKNPFTNKKCTVIMYL